jgi:DNA-binding Lrp family transcriptional regulator
MLNHKEKQLVQELRKSKSQNILELSRKINMPKSTVYDMIHRLEEKAIIDGRVHLDFEKIGFPIRIFLIVKTEKEYKDALKKYLIGQKHINNIFTINRASSFHVESIFRNQKEVEEFLEDLEQKNTLIQLSVYTILEHIEKERFLTKEEHFE